MGKMQARENFVTYTEFGGKTQIVILMRQYDLECKFRRKKKHCTDLFALSTNQISYQVVFTVDVFQPTHTKIFFSFHLKIQKNLKVFPVNNKMYNFFF